ncbi:hypothetical protein RQP46_005448 [Phenoliferia psychrophenolica]
MQCFSVREVVVPLRRRLFDLMRFILETAKVTRGLFWVILATRVLLSFKPAARAYFTGKMGRQFIPGRGPMPRSSRQAELLNRFDLLETIEMISNATGIAGGAGFLLGQLTWTTAPVLALAFAFEAIYLFAWRDRSDPMSINDHCDNPHMILANAFHLGTSSKHRREVETLDLSSKLLDDFKRAKAEIDARPLWAESRKWARFRSNPVLNVFISSMGYLTTAFLELRYGSDPSALVSTLQLNELMGTFYALSDSKSTLIGLLARSFIQRSGEVLVNDKPMESYRPGALASRARFTFQSTRPLPYSIKQYVALGLGRELVADVPDDLVESALSATSALDHTATLHHGWNSYTGGSNEDQLSSTFWTPQIVPTYQRGPTVHEGWSDRFLNTLTEEKEPCLDVKIAEPNFHSFNIETADKKELTSLVNPDTELLVLDEPASAMDAASEAALFDSIVALKGKTTTIFSSHRLAMSAKADVILVLRDGKLVEQGSHPELMEREGGEYRAMFELQASGFEDVVVEQYGTETPVSTASSETDKETLSD